MHRIKEIKNFFFEKINNIDKPLAKVIKRQREKIQSRDEKMDITLDTEKIQKIIATYLKNMFSTTWKM